MPPKTVNIVMGSLERGGTEKFAVNFSNYLITKGFQVNLVLLKKTHCRDNFELLHQDVDVKEIISPIACLFIPFYFFRFRRYLALGSEMTLGLHGLGNIATLFLSRRKYGVIVTSLRRELPSVKKSPLIFFMILISFWHSHITLVNSSFLSSKLSKLKLNPRFHPNGILPTQFQVKSVINPDVFTIFTIANLRPEKNLQMVLKVAERLKGAPIRFLIAGSGNLQETLEREIRSKKLNVDLLGYVSDVNMYFSMSDLYLQTSISEGSPNAILEAMAFGLPVVASDIPSSREIMGSSKTLFELSDIEGAVGLIWEIYSNPELRESLSKQNMSIISNSFDQNTIFNQILESIQREV